MLLNIDIETAILIIIVGHFFTCVLTIAYQLQRPKHMRSYAFVFARIFDVVGWTLISIEGVIPDFFTTFLGSSCLIIAISCQTAAILKAQNSYTEIIKRFYIVFSFLYIFVISIYSLVFPDYSVRGALLGEIFTTLWIYPVYKLLTNDESTFLHKVVAVIYIFGMLPYLYEVTTIFYSVLILHESYNVISETMSLAFVFFSLYLTMLIGNIGVILIAKEKSDIQMMRDAMYDDLTGICNRRTFWQHVEELLSDHSLRGTTFVFLLVDIDHFKEINDTHGHFVGDLVLQDFVAKVKGNLNKADIFGRIGGEEFAILIPDADEGHGVMTAEAIRTTIADSTFNETIHYTVSIGSVTVLSYQNINIDMLYKTGDIAMYEAKLQGRNRIKNVILK